MADKRYADLLHSLDAEQLSYPGTFEEALAIADTLPRCRTLDVPCGPGRMAEALSRIGFSAYAADLNAAGYRGSNRQDARARRRRGCLGRVLPRCGNREPFYSPGLQERA